MKQQIKPPRPSDTPPSEGNCGMSMFFNAIVPTNTSEAYQQEVNEIFLNTIAEGIVIDSTTSMQLLNIALDHSFLYPDAVFTARAMLGIDVDESEVLEIQTKETKPLPNKNSPSLSIINSQFSIYPNPSDGEIIVEYTGDSLCNATFELYNIYGVKLLEEKIYSKKQRLVLKSINEGVYFYRIINCNAIVNRNKLIITK